MGLNFLHKISFKLQNSSKKEKKKCICTLLLRSKKILSKWPLLCVVLIIVKIDRQIQGMASYLLLYEQWAYTYQTMKIVSKKWMGLRRKDSKFFDSCNSTARQEDKHPFQALKTVGDVKSVRERFFWTSHVSVLVAHFMYLCWVHVEYLWADSTSFVFKTTIRYGYEAFQFVLNSWVSINMS